MNIWTQIYFFPLLTSPQGSQGGQKIRSFFLQIKLSSSCAKITLKLKKPEKLVKMEKKIIKNPFFHKVFKILINLGSIVAFKILLRGFLQIF